MNSDAGFNSKNLKRSCDSKAIKLNVKENPKSRKGCQPTTSYLDDMLYNENRYKIERTNA
jgi:hypothetical protein